MKLPKKVKICGKEYKVILNPKSGDGYCDAKEAVISVGTAIPGDVLDIFLHEILEMIFLERGCRFSVYASGNDKLLMAMTHSEFENCVKDLAATIGGMLK